MLCKSNQEIIFRYLFQIRLHVTYVSCLIFRNLHFLPNIKDDQIKDGPVHVARMGWRIKVLEENLKEKAHLEDLCVDGKGILKKNIAKKYVRFIDRVGLL